MRMPMSRIVIFKIALFTIAALALPLALIHAQAKEETSTVKVEATKTDTAKPEQFKPEQQASKGSVTIGGNVINYDALPARCRTSQGLGRRSAERATGPQKQGPGSQHVLCRLLQVWQ